MGAEERANVSGGPGYRLPPGWNNIPGGEAMLEYFWRKWMKLDVRNFGPTVFAVDSLFLATGAIGLVLLAIGLLRDTLVKENQSENPLLELKLIGVVTLFVASMGFLVYDSLRLSEIDAMAARDRSEFLRPGGDKMLRDCSITLVTFSVLLVLAIVGLTVIKLFEVNLPDIAVNALGYSCAVLFIGQIVPASVGLDVALTFETWFYHQANYNRSATIKHYVDGAPRIPRALPKPPGDGPTVWDECGVPDTFFIALAIAPPGTLDGLIPFPYAYSVPGKNPPYPQAQDYPWDEFLDWDDLYQTAVEVPGCYGTVWDRESIAKAQKEKDLCRLRLKSVEKCGPGCSAGLMQDALCSDFKVCKREFERRIAQWRAVAAENVTRPGESPRFELPVGWDHLPEFESAAVDAYRRRVRTVLLLDPWFWLIFHAPLLGMGIVGWVSLVIGLFVGGVRRHNEFEGISTW
jgi:hypothetical protein